VLVDYDRWLINGSDLREEANAIEMLFAYYAYLNTKKLSQYSVLTSVLYICIAYLLYIAGNYYNKFINIE